MQPHPATTPRAKLISSHEATRQGRSVGFARYAPYCAITRAPARCFPLAVQCQHRQRASRARQLRRCWQQTPTRPASFKIQTYHHIQYRGACVAGMHCQALVRQVLTSLRAADRATHIASVVVYLINRLTLVKTFSSSSKKLSRSVDHRRKIHPPRPVRQTFTRSRTFTRLQTSLEVVRAPRTEPAPPPGVTENAVLRLHGRSRSMYVK